MFVSTHLSRRSLLSGSLGLLLLGCAKKNTQNKPPPVTLLNKPKSSDNSIAFEFARLLVPVYRRQLLENVWDEVDQMLVSVQTRKTLIRNGMRVGVAGQALPSSLRSLMQAIPVAEDQLNEMQRQMLAAGLLQPESVLHGHIRIGIQPGQTRDLDVSQMFEMTWLWQGDPGRSHHRYQNATSKLRVSMSPGRDGSVNLGVIPVVAHGPRVPVYDADPSDKFSVGVSQQEAVLMEASTRVPVKLGETLLVGPTFDPNARHEHTPMGSVFFKHQGNTPGDCLVLMRLIETTFNPLFQSPA